MKKPVFNLAVICLLAYSVTSCGKSSVSKMSNKWKVTSYSESSASNTSIDWAEEGTSNSFVRTNSNDIITLSQSGVINENSFTINKDGTWASKKDYTYSYQTIYPDTADVTNNTVISESGTWAFVGTNKTEDFKKNERVVFYTLSSQEDVYLTSISGGSTTNDNSSNLDTYSASGPSITYVIKESSAKKLVLSSDGENTHSDTSNGNTNTNSNTDKGEMTLEQK
jgi:hypothetical protein